VVVVVVHQIRDLANSLWRKANVSLVTTAPLLILRFVVSLQREHVNSEKNARIITQKASSPPMLILIPKLSLKIQFKEEELVAEWAAVWQIK
jgi:hypothetical protein